MRKFLTLLVLVSSFGIAFAQNTQYRMFVHQGGSYSAEAITTDIQQMNLDEDDNIEIHTVAGTLTFTVSSIDSITFHSVEEGMLPGVFSVSANRTIRFSKGNMQYHAAQNKWRFAENQYDYVGEKNSNISSYYNGWIDLFGWGTSGWNNGGQYYQPWDYSAESVDSKLFGPYGEFNLTGDYAYCDWAYYNQITNGGVLTDRWRTLLNEEWAYLYEGRANAYSLRSQAKVCDVNGYILLPDNWSTPAGCSFTPNSGSFNTNTYDESKWADMEAAGAVFLPAAGGRAAQILDEIGTGGHYWSASYYNINMAYSFYFDSSMAMPSYFYSLRYLGFSVRPVVDL